MLGVERALREAHEAGDCRWGCPVCAEYRGHLVRSQPKRGGYIAKVVAPDGTEYGPFIGTTQDDAEGQARAKIRELVPWRDLDEEPLTDEEQAERASETYIPPRPKRQGLSQFLKGEEA